MNIHIPRQQLFFADYWVIKSFCVDGKRTVYLGRFEKQVKEKYDDFFIC